MVFAYYTAAQTSSPRRCIVGLPETTFGRSIASNGAEGAKNLLCDLDNLIFLCA